MSIDSVHAVNSGFCSESLLHRQWIPSLLGEKQHNHEDTSRQRQDKDQSGGLTFAAEVASSQAADRTSGSSSNIIFRCPCVDLCLSVSWTHLLLLLIPPADLISPAAQGWMSKKVQLDLFFFFPPHQLFSTQVLQKKGWFGVNECQWLSKVSSSSPSELSKLMLDLGQNVCSQ